MTENLPSILGSIRLRRPDPMGDAMRRAARVFSALGLTLMVLGFAAALLVPGPNPLPGRPMTTVDAPIPFSDLSQSIGFLAMSAGIGILAILPVARIIVALWIYWKAGNPAAAFTALAVLIELAASSQVGKR